MNSLVNLVAMQIGWFACVLGAARNWPWLGVAVSLAIGAAHLARSMQPRAEGKLLVAAVAMGLILDSVFAATDLIAFSSGSLIDGLTTPWMLGLWVSFATTLTGSLRWLMMRPALAALFGAVGGPAAYWSGAQLGAMTLAMPRSALLSIGLGWAAAMLIFVALTRHLALIPAREALGTGVRA